MNPKGKSILIGCGIGCAGLVVLVIVAAISFAIWVNRPGELLEPARLLGRDTTGYAEWTLRLDDPGTEGFVRLLLQAIRETPVDRQRFFPPFIRSWLEGRRNREAEEDLLRLFPMVAAWTSQPGAAAEGDLHLVSLSVEKIGNQLVFGDWALAWIMGRAEGSRAQRYKSERIYQAASADRVWTFFLRGSAVFLASDLETAERAVDRLEASDTEHRTATDLERLFAEAEAGPPLRGALTNGRGEIARLLQQLSRTPIEEAETWNAARGVFASGALQADGTFAARVELVAPDAAWAAAHVEQLTASLRTSFEHSYLKFDVQGASAGDRLRFDLHIPDLVGSLKRWMEEAGQIEHGPGGIRIRRTVHS